MIRISKIKPYALRASRIYYEYTFKAKGHFAIDHHEQVSVYGLQGFTGTRTLELIKQEQKREELSLSIIELRAKRYFILGRHAQSHELLHQDFLSIGLKKVNKIDLIHEDDLVFLGQQVDDSYVSELEPYRAWLVDELETIALHEHIQSINSVEEEEFRHRYDQMFSYYLEYPRLKLSNQRLQTLLPFQDLVQQREASPQMLARLRMIVLGSKTKSKSTSAPIQHANGERLSCVAIRWSSSQLCWANLAVIMWRAHKAQEIQPFGLSMMRLLQLLCFSQVFAPRLQLLLVCPTGITQGKKRKKLIQHREVWHKWFGQDIQVLQISSQDYDALDRGQRPSLATISKLQENMEHLSHIHQCLDPFDDFPLFSFKLILEQQLTFNSLPRFIQIIKRLGLAQNIELKNDEISLSPTWYLAQALSQQCLFDAFGEYGDCLIKILEQLSGSLKPINSVQRTPEPLLLNAPQAILLCDLLNLCLDYDTVYLNQEDLTRVLSHIPIDKDSFIDHKAWPETDRSQLAKSLAKLTFKTRPKDTVQLGFRMLSFIERESLESDYSHSKGDSWYALKGDLQAWSGAYEWTHDDFFYWNLEFDQVRVQQPFWASINNVGAHQNLEQARLQKWHNSTDHGLRTYAGSSAKSNHGLASLRLIYEPG